MFASNKTFKLEVMFACMKFFYNIWHKKLAANYFEN